MSPADLAARGQTDNRRTSCPSLAAQRWAMAGRPMGFHHKLRNGLRMWKKHRRHTDYEIRTTGDRFGTIRDVLEQHTGRAVRGARVLEVGCGQRAALSLLLAANGASVCALDLELPTYQLSVGQLLDVIRRSGAHRAIKSTVRHLLFDRRFFSGLEQSCSVALRPWPQLQTLVCDVAHADLPVGEFDLVCAFDVLGHVADVESAVRKMCASLKPDGIGYVVIHLYPSLTGADCLDWVFALDPEYAAPTPASILPWDHLRGGKYPGDSFLNGLRLHDYQRVFSQHAEVVQETRKQEGLALLPLAPRHLLEEYTEEDLTTAYVAFTFRPRRDACSHPSPR